MRDYTTISKRLRMYSENCVAYKLDADFANAVTDAADAIEELLDELTTIRKQLPHWISVEERLPKTDHEVLVCCVNSFYPEDRWIHVDWVEENGKWYKHDIVTHWMPKPPLPAPPKGVE